MTATLDTTWMRAAALQDVLDQGSLVAHVNGSTLALFAAEGQVYAVDNRCPHMGFPLSKGSVKDCILTCHWHHARFDLTSGGTFDQWADDVRVFPVEVRGGDVWVDLAPRMDQVKHQRNRLRDGLERNISLVIAKAVIHLLDAGVDPVEPFRIGLEFGTRNRRGGWGQGLTILSCMMNLLPALDPESRPRALFHGLSAVAGDSAGQPPRFLVRPLPDSGADLATLKRWFRRFVEVRDSEGAERCILSALEQGADDKQMADMLLAAATDHRYISTGHPLDFTNKAFEALDRAGWDLAEPVLASLAPNYAGADRMEESNAWRNPVDLIGILQAAFEQLPGALEQGKTRGGEGEKGRRGEARISRTELAQVVLGDEPARTVEALLEAVRAGMPPQELAGAVVYGALLRVARFHTSNEFFDWDRALHTFTFANAVHQGLRRVPSPDLLRGVFDAAMSVYLDRFLNVPAARIPEGRPGRDGLGQLPDLLDRQQQVNPAAELVADCLASGGAPERLMASLGEMLLREDRDFHTIQCVEASFRQYRLLSGTPEANHALIAAARYLAAHSPTMRTQGQTYQIASRLHRGEKLFEE